MAETDDVRPQRGPQEMFLTTPADIAIYGGSAGSGKSFAILMEPLRHILNVKGYGAVIFRRNTTQVRNEGGLWDTSNELYPYVGAFPRETTLEWIFPPYANKVKFAHLEYDKTVNDWQGSQIAFIGFDELTHFSNKQFFYMLSRNRSVCGIKPYIRATTNPDSESWVAEFIAWWIDPETGYPIPERAGKIRWMARYNNQIFWDDTPELLFKQVHLFVKKEHFRPKSVTFIPAKLEDNPILEAKNPDYRSNLLALSLVDRERLLGGNWKIKPTSGTMFRRAWFQIVESYPAGCKFIRAWDKAATEGGGDWTCGVKIGVWQGITYIVDLQRQQGSPLQNENLIRITADLDGRNTRIYMEQEPGSSGVDVIDHYSREVLRGFIFKGHRSTGSKIDRAKPLSAHVEAGNVKIVKAPWNETFIEELERFPSEDPKAHDDIVDACSLAFNQSTGVAEPGVAMRSVVKSKYSEGMGNWNKYRR